MRRLILLVIALVVLPVLVSAAEWERLTSGVADHLYGIDFVSPDQGYAVGWGASTGGVVVRTVDGGDNWTHTTLSANSYLFDVTFTDENNGYVAGCLNGGSAAAIWRTTNGGASWTYQAFGTSWGFYAVEFPDPATGFACGWNGRIYKTINSGASWFSLSSGTTYVFRYLDFTDATHGYAISGSNYNNSNLVHKTTNGSSWMLVKNFGTGMIIGGVHFFDENTGIIAGNDGAEAILKTYDGGLTWENRHSGPSGYTLQGLSGQGDECIAVGHAGRILLSHDAGETWTLDAATVPITTLLAANVKDGAWFCAGTSGRIFERVNPTSGVPESPLSMGPRLLPNRPNPFNPSTQIEFKLARSGHVKLEIFDARARLVRVLLNDSRSAGRHHISWDGRNGHGQRVPSGLYFCLITTNDGTDSRKLNLLK